MAEMPRWYVVHTKPKQEYRAADNLAAWGIETLAPKMKERSGASSLKRGYRIAPLFPQYVFARFDASALWTKVRFTHGVQDIVNFGMCAISVDDAVIEFIRERIQPDGFVRLTPPQPGEMVEIIEGPFRSVVGIFERELSSSDRVVILLRTLGSCARLQVAKSSIQKVLSHASCR